MARKPQRQHPEPSIQPQPQAIRARDGHYAGPSNHIQLLLDQCSTGSLDHIQAALTYACEKASQLLDSENDTTVLRGIHTLSQAAAQYARLFEIHELSRRLDLLEAQLMSTGDNGHAASL